MDSETLVTVSFSSIPMILKVMAIENKRKIILWFLIGCSLIMMLTMKRPIK